MARYQIAGPDGATYEITAPDDASEDEVWQYFRSQLEQQAPEPEEPVQENPDGTFGTPPEGVVYNPATGQMEDLRSPVNPNIMEGRGTAAAIGAGQGLGFNLLDEASAFVSSLLGGDYNYNLERMRESERRAAEDNPVSYYGGMLGGAVGTGAGLAKSGLSLGANAVNAGWRLPGVALASAGEGGLLGAAYGAGAGEGAEDRGGQAAQGLALGAILGAATPFAVKGASKVAERAISPFRTSPERVAAARVLEQEGIPLTAGQRTGSKWLQYRESELGGARAADMMEDQAKAFTDAVMRRAGGSGLADPDNLAALRNQIGQGFDDVAARNTLRADTRFSQDMSRTLREYARVLPSEQRQILANTASDLVERLQLGGGTLSGRDYQSIRSRLSRRAQNARGNDPELAAAYRGIRDALDSAMERSINPADAGRWSELRRQYGNYKTISKAATGGGESAGLGLISPARLRMAAASGNQEGFATGANEFTRLAKAGQALMTPLPNSGTAQRIAAQGIAAALLGGTGGAVGGPIGLAAGLAGPALAGRALMSSPVQRYLSNQAARPMTPERQALLNALLVSMGSAASPRLPSPGLGGI